MMPSAHATGTAPCAREPAIALCTGATNPEGMRMEHARQSPTGPMPSCPDYTGAIPPKLVGTSAAKFRSLSFRCCLLMLFMLVFVGACFCLLFIE